MINLGTNYEDPTQILGTNSSTCLGTNFGLTTYLRLYESFSLHPS